MEEKVSIVKCEDYEPERVYQKVKEGVNLLGGIESFINKGDQVLLKPNFLIGRAPEKCVNTHPEVVKAVARLVLESGANPVIGDSPQLGSALKVAEKCGVAEVARELGIEIVEFEPVEVKHPDGKFFKHFVLGKAVLEADKIINLPKLKTHGLTFLTLAVKNIFGCVPGARKAQWHVSTSQKGSEYFSRMLLDLYTLINPALSIVDGIISMEGKGPGFGKPRNLGLIIAGNDAVAVDTVIAEIVGASPEQFVTLRVALNEHYGTAHINDIEVLGELIDRVKIDDYQFPPKITEIKGFLKTFMGFLKGYLTTCPFINRKQCAECNNCIEACPLKCITSYNGSLAINSKECIQCLCCMEVCPNGAIELKDGSLLKLLKHF
ncbi:MAG: DUF362 domain-containing protein [Deltaproteobacteria bacterium]|nr:DUF362 domain-containing protein [Deltaproteobacteria bacterium]